MQFILEPSLQVPPTSSTDQKGTRPSSKQSTKPATSYAIAAPAGVPLSANSRVTSTSEGGASGKSYAILLQTLVEAWCNANYPFMRALHVWHLELPDEEIVALVSRCAKATGPVHAMISLRRLCSWSLLSESTLCIWRLLTETYRRGVFPDWLSEKYIIMYIRCD